MWRIQLELWRLFLYACHWLSGIISTDVEVNPQAIYLCWTGWLRPCCVNSKPISRTSTRKASTSWPLTMSISSFTVQTRSSDGTISSSAVLKQRRKPTGRGSRPRVTTQNRARLLQALWSAIPSAKWQSVIWHTPFKVFSLLNMCLA